MIEIWGRQTSVNVQKVMWTAAELGVEVHRHDAGGAFGIVQDDEFAALNPNRLVPVLRDGDLVLWESNTIVRYLANRSGDETFWPSDAAGRARHECWLDWAGTTLGPHVNALFMQLVRTRAPQRNMALLEASAAQAQRRFATLDAVLAGHEFVAGERFTIADIGPGATAFRWFNTPTERPHLPHLESWYNRLTARPSFRYNVMIPAI